MEHKAWKVCVGCRVAGGRVPAPMSGVPNEVNHPLSPFVAKGERAGLRVLLRGRRTSAARCVQDLSVQRLMGLLASIRCLQIHMRAGGRWPQR